MIKKACLDSKPLSDPSTHLRSIGIDGRPHLMLTSWRNLLDSTAAQVGAAGDTHTETDIRQLRGLTEQQDEEAFLPLRREELGPEFPRRLLGFRRLIDDAAARVCADPNLKSFYDKNRRAAEGCYLRTTEYWWLGIRHDLWSKTGSTPLWLCIWPGSDRLSDLLKELRDFNPIEGDPPVAVPIYLLAGKEYNAVLDDVVRQLTGIAARLRPSSEP